MVTNKISFKRIKKAIDTDQWVIGIDLGTTNSVVAYIEGSKPQTIINEEGEWTTPSVVAYPDEGGVLVGEMARRQAVMNPKNTFYSVKRFIGRTLDELDSTAKRVPYNLIAEDERIQFECPNLKKSISPEEISAQVLRKLVRDAETYLGGPAKIAVITVPAYFNAAQRQATQDAAFIAEIEVLRIINEPTAAALSYGLSQTINQTLFVADLGGGTFDVSVLEIGQSLFEVISTSGNTTLGGDNFDEKIVQWLLAKFYENEGIDLTSNSQALQRLTEASEKAKIELSTVSETTIYLPFLANKVGTARHLKEVLSKTLFEELCSDLIARCRAPIRKSLKDADLTIKKIDESILVGGSTRIPEFQQLIKAILKKIPNKTTNPDESVAQGAALQAGVLAGEISGLVLLDVTPLSLGIETQGGLVAVITPRNTMIPSQKFQDFSTVADNQTHVEIHVLQGERPFARDNKSLGIFSFTGLTPALRGVAKIVVTFKLDSRGLLSVTAKDEMTEKEQSITITGSSNLSKERVERLVQEASKKAINDDKKTENIKLKNSTADLCYEVRKTLREQDPKVDSSTREELESLVNQAEKAIKDQNFTDVPSILLDIRARLNNLPDANTID